MQAFKPNYLDMKDFDWRILNCQSACKTVWQKSVKSETSRNQLNPDLFSQKQYMFSETHGETRLRLKRKLDLPCHPRNVYEMLRLISKSLLELWSHEWRKWVGTTLIHEVGHSDPMLTKPGLEMSCHLLRVCNELQVKIVKLVDENCGNLHSKKPSRRRRKRHGIKWNTVPIKLHPMFTLVYQIYHQICRK